MTEQLPTQPAQQPQPTAVQSAAPIPQTQEIPNPEALLGMMPTVCPSCKAMVQPGFQFCPNCGKPIDKNRNIGIGKQISVYTTSLLLPPFGLIWGIKYLLSPNKQVKIVGAVATIITIVSLIVNIVLFSTVWSQIQKYISVYQGLTSGNYSNMPDLNQGSMNNLLKQLDPATLQKLQNSDVNSIPQ